MSSSHKPVRLPDGPIRDDQILPLTRWLARLIVPVLALGFILLYIWPDDTQEMFAWTIRPRMTPLLMGAGYLGGAYFFLRSALAEKWHHIAVGFLPVTTFASFMTLATLLHWENFNHTHPAFFVWAILYAVTPFLVFYAWWQNRKRDTGLLDAGDMVLPAAARWIMGVFGFVILVTGILLFVFPSLMIDIWPWTLSPKPADGTYRRGLVCAAGGAVAGYCPRSPLAGGPHRPGKPGAQPGSDFVGRGPRLG